MGEILHITQEQMDVLKSICFNCGFFTMEDARLLNQNSFLASQITCLIRCNMMRPICMLRDVSLLVAVIQDAVNVNERIRDISFTQASLEFIRTSIGAGTVQVKEG
jgi:hypothetical protein